MSVDHKTPNTPRAKFWDFENPQEPIFWPSWLPGLNSGFSQTSKVWPSQASSEIVDFGFPLNMGFGFWFGFWISFTHGVWGLDSDLDFGFPLKHGIWIFDFSWTWGWIMQRWKAVLLWMFALQLSWCAGLTNQKTQEIKKSWSESHKVICFHKLYNQITSPLAIVIQNHFSVSSEQNRRSQLSHCEWIMKLRLDYNLTFLQNHDSLLSARNSPNLVGHQVNAIKTSFCFSPRRSEEEKHLKRCFDMFWLLTGKRISKNMWHMCALISFVPTSQ